MVQHTDRLIGHNENDMIVVYIKASALESDPAVHMRKEWTELPEWNEMLIPLYFCFDMVNSRRGIIVEHGAVDFCIGWASMEALGRESASRNLKAEFANKIDKVKYTEAVTRESPGLSEPWLEGVKTDDHWGIIYSKYDFGCQLAGHLTPGIKAIAGFDAYKVATNIAGYSLLGF